MVPEHIFPYLSTARSLAGTRITAINQTMDDVSEIQLPLFECPHIDPVDRFGSIDMNYMHHIERQDIKMNI